MRFVSIGLAVTILLGLCGCTAEVSETVADTQDTSLSASESEETALEKTDTLVYVSLGDSIARGHGLADVEAERFSTVVEEILTEALPDTTVSVYNYGVDGLTAWGLWEKLVDGQIVIPADTDVISISLGANHILSEMIAFLTESTMGYNANDSMAELIKNVERNGSLFGGELTMIMEEIRKAAPEAKIYFLTFYDPFPGIQLDGLDGMTADVLMDDCVRQINNWIYGMAETEGYTMVDVYTAFAEAEESLIVAEIPERPLTESDLYGLDPHPNAAGHRVIGELLGEAILSERQSGR